MLKHLSDRLAASHASLVIQERLWIIPTVQAIHILAIAFLLFSAFSANVAILRGQDRTGAAPWLPSAWHWTWGALLVLLATGTILVVGEPDRSLLNLLFRIKMALVLVAVALTIAFQRLSRGPDGFAPGPAARWGLVAFSTVLWLAIVFCGRLIAYFGGLTA